MRMFPRQFICDGFVNYSRFFLLQLFGLRKSPCFQCTEKSYCLAQFSLYEEVRKRTITLLLALYAASFSHESRSHVVRVFHEFFKRATTPTVKLKLYARANTFGVIDRLGAL